MARTTRNNPSPGGLRPPLETPKRPRAPRGKKLPAKPVVDSAPAPVPAPAPVVASPAPSTTAPSPSPSDDETEAPTPTRPSSPLQRLTSRVTRSMSRESSRSVSPPIIAMVDNAKNIFKDVGKAIAKSTTKKGRNTQQESDAKPNKLQKKNKNAQPLGAICREKRAHSQVSLSSLSSDEEEPHPSKKIKNTTELDTVELRGIDPTQTVFNTRVPQINRKKFPPRDQHVAAPTEPVHENEEDISHFSCLDDGNQSTPRPLEQTTSVPTAEAEAASPSLVGQHLGSQAVNPRRIPRLAKLKSMPKVTDAKFRRRPAYAPAEEEDIFDMDAIPIAKNSFASNRRIREALLPKKEVLGSPRVEKPKPRKSNREKHPAAYSVYGLLISINRGDVTESARTMTRWAQENPGISMPNQGKLYAMLEAYKAELSTPNHTREDVSQDTSSRARAEPATGMTHESPREMGVATTSHHFSPSESLAPPTTPSTPTTPTANVHIVPNETLEITSPPETPTPPPTIGRARAAFQGFSSMVDVVTSPLKRIFGHTERAGPLNPIPCGRRIPQNSLTLTNIDLAEREEQMKRERERQRARQHATIEDAEDESNPPNRTLGEDGQQVGHKRRNSGTYCFPESSYCDDTSMTSESQSTLPICYVHPGRHHQPPSNPSQLHQPTNPYLSPNPCKVTEEVSQDLQKYYPNTHALAPRSPHWQCSLAYRNDYWAQVSVIQCDMTNEERAVDDLIRNGGPEMWERHHGIYVSHNSLGINWLNGKIRDEKYIQKMWEVEHPGPKAKEEELKKRREEELKRREEELKRREEELEKNKLVKSFKFPVDEDEESMDDENPVAVEPTKSATVLQEIDRNQTPPATPKPANAALPKTPYDILNKPAKPSGLREVMVMSPPLGQGTGKENAFIPSNKPFKWTLGGEPEIRVMEDTKEPILMDEWKEAAEAFLRTEGMEPLPNAFW